MAHTTLIDTVTVAARLTDSDLAVIDCRFLVDNPDWGGGEYTAAHIPGAVFADMGRDLAASRLWWLLRWLGHQAVAVLDGGFAKWIAEGRPVADGVEAREPRVFKGTPRHDMAIGADLTAEAARSAGWRVIDARAPERYRGEQETLDKAAGHIPGAVNHFYKWNVSENGTLLSPVELRARLLETTGDVPSDRIVCYCGSGVTACHNLLALEHAGLRGAKLYPGSWSEWSSDPSRPVATTTR
jgi:thiosulfate/3-mercaptopyruvate sulfurtransferase